MNNLEFIRLAWEAVRSHKVRSALTLLGMVIGVFAIIVAVTAVQVIEDSINNTIQSFGSTTFSVHVSEGVQVDHTGRRARQNLTYRQMELLQERAQMPVSMRWPKTTSRSTGRSLSGIKSPRPKPSCTRSASS